MDGQSHVLTIQPKRRAKFLHLGVLPHRRALLKERGDAFDTVVGPE
jgi:hypothetical protein